MGACGIQRVSQLRQRQFTEDAGPMAHPIRPDSYQKMDNFYTATVYEKGAEVVRLYRTLLGVEGFRKGMDLYFARHDGQAVTVEDFYNAMADANNAHGVLQGLQWWYAQAGTPTLKVSTSYDAAARSYSLTATQELPDSPRQPAANKHPQLIPLAVGLISSSGKAMPLHLQGKDDVHDDSTIVLPLRERSQTFVFTNVDEQPVPSLLRGFSAPVHLEYGRTDEELCFLLEHDSDEFCRWDAFQTLSKRHLLSLVANTVAGEQLTENERLVSALRASLQKAIGTDGAGKVFAARLMALPSEGEITELVQQADPYAIRSARAHLVHTLAQALRPELEAIVMANEEPAGEEYSPNVHQRGRRAIRNACLWYLSSLGDVNIMNGLLLRMQQAGNMTDQLGALACLASRACAQRQEALDFFHEQWKHEDLVMVKWLGLQATADIPGNIAQLRSLINHSAFDIRNPNKVYALMGGASSSALNFHNLDGSGYDFLTDNIITLDSINPMVAARLASPFTRYQKYDHERQGLMKARLLRIVNTPGLSENVYEIVSKSLE